MKILIAGDFFPTGRVKELFDNRDFGTVLNNISPIVKSADYSIINYESPVVLNNYSPITKCGPNLSSNKNGIEAIKWAGFNMATLANNHIYDFGKEGLNDTIQVCREYDIDTTEVGLNLQEAQQIFYKDIQSKSFAIINCCEHEFSIADTNVPGANPLNPIMQYYQIQNCHD